MSLDNLADTLSESQSLKGRLFLGTVVDDQDPEGLGRFKAQVPELFEDGQLPWIGRFRESPFGMGPGYGTFGTPHVGSSVIIELQEGDANYPRCVAFYPKSSDVPDVFKNGRVWGYKDPSGTTLVVNPDEKLYHFIHASGTEYKIDETGSLTADIKSHVNITINGNTNLITTGNLTAQVDGSTTVNSGGPANVTAPSVNIDAANTNMSGNLTVEGVITGNSGINISGDNGSGEAATISGNVNHSGGLLVSNNVSLSGHNHPNTGAPIPGT